MSETEVAETPKIGLSEISRRIKAYGVKDEWAVYCRVAGGNHTAAFMLRRCAIWSSGKRVQDKGGWFYKCAADWREEACLGRSALETATGLLEAAGLIETDVRQVEVNSRYAVGKTVKHYRLDAGVFYARLDAVLRDLTGQKKEGQPPVIDEEAADEAADENAPGMPESSKTECANPAFGDAENQQSVMPESDINECGEPTSPDAGTVHLNLSLVSNLKSSSVMEDQNLRSTTAEREIAYLDSLKSKFSGFEMAQDRLLLEYQRVGRNAFDETLERCKNRGAHWNYVLAALALVDAPPPPTPSPTAGVWSDWVTVEPLQEMQPLELSTEQRHWQTAYAQLKLQLDRTSFDTWLQGAKFRRVDEQGVYVIDTGSDYQAQMCQHRLYPSIRRVLSDVVGAAEVQVRFEALKQGVMV